jgi:hypothetical protein
MFIHTLLNVSPKNMNKRGSEVIFLTKLIKKKRKRILSKGMSVPDKCRRETVKEGKDNNKWTKTIHSHG